MHPGRVEDATVVRHVLPGAPYGVLQPRQLPRPQLVERQLEPVPQVGDVVVGDVVVMPAP